MCKHENLIAVKEICIPEELFEGITVTSDFFVSTDFTCVTSGMLVPLDMLLETASNEVMLKGCRSCTLGKVSKIVL